MRLSDYLDPVLVVCDLQAADSWDLLSQISERVCGQHPELDKKVVLSKLQEREAKAICAVVRLADPIDLGTLDGSPVSIVFALISPPEAVASHIRILARIARLCSLPAFIEKMNQAKDDAALYEIIHEEDNRHV